MLRLNRLNGFWSQRDTVAAIAQSGVSPALPSYAWTFDTGDDPGKEFLVGAPHLTLSGAWGQENFPSARGSALQSFVGGSASARIYSVLAKWSVSGWFFPFESDDTDMFKIAGDDGSYSTIYISATTASTFSVWVEWFDGGSATTQYELLTSQPIYQKYHFGMAVDHSGKTLLAVVNGTTYTSTADIADVPPSVLSINASATGTGTTIRDELYLWQGATLAAENYAWLYNGAAGRFVQTVNGIGSW